MTGFGFWTGRPVLVTGAAGYLGRTLAAEVAARGARVLGVDLVSPRHGFPGDVLAVDLRDIPAVSALLAERGIRTCFHLAGQAGVPQSQADPAAAFEANVRATWCLLDACRRCNPPPEVVVASSNHIYGPQETRPTPEGASLRGTGPYAVSKACADMVAQCFARSYGLPVAIARITNTFGGADPHADHLVTGTILAVLRGEGPVIRGDGRSEKGYLYIRDTVEAFLHLAERIGPLRLGGEAFNFVPDAPVAVQDMVATILRVAGRTDLSPVVLGQAGRPVEREHLSNTKAARVLGWRPRYSLEAGIAEVIQGLAHHTGLPPAAG